MAVPSKIIRPMLKLALSAAAQAAEQVAERLRIDGLHEVVIETRLARPASILLLSITRQRD
jgi:hypothetical protein